jgi:hypothetical protein
MTKKIKVALLALTGLSLLSCAKTNEVLPAGKYESGLFENNFYTGRHDFSSKSCTESSTKTLSSDQYFNGDNAEALGTYSSLVTFDGATVSRQGLKAMYPEVLNYTANGTTSALTTDPLHDWRYVDVGHDSEYVGKSFGRTKCLATANDAFKNGFLSKLYDGQLYCNGDHMRALVQVDSNGYDAFFPKTMVSGDYFLMSMRGGSNYLENVTETSSGKTGDVVRRLTEFDAQLKFYTVSAGGYTYNNILAKDVVVRTDSGGEGVTWFGFKFSAIGIASTAGIVGFSFSYTNFRDPAIDMTKESADRSKDSTFYWGAMVYEVMFPDSSWK